MVNPEGVKGILTHYYKLEDYSNESEVGYNWVIYNVCGKHCISIYMHCKPLKVARCIENDFSRRNELIDEAQEDTIYLLVCNDKDMEAIFKDREKIIEELVTLVMNANCKVYEEIGSVLGLQS